jgi:hypothetical protein
MAEQPPSELLAAQIASLSAEEFVEVVERHRQLASEANRHSGPMPPRPSLLTPRPAPAPEIASE